MNFADVRRSRAEIEHVRQNYYRVENTIEELRAKILENRNLVYELKLEISDLEHGLPDQLVASKINIKQIELEDIHSIIKDLKDELAKSESQLEVARIELDKMTQYEPNIEKSEIAIEKFKLQLIDYRRRIEAENASQAGRNMAERERIQHAEYEKEIEMYEKRLDSAIEARKRISGFLEDSAVSHAQRKNELELMARETENNLTKNLERLRTELDQSRHNLDAIQLKQLAQKEKQKKKDDTRLNELIKNGMTKPEAAFELKQIKKKEKLRQSIKFVEANQEARKVAILSKILNEESSIEKRQKMNPILFNSDRHTLPRGTNTDQILYERDQRQRQQFKKIRPQLSSNAIQLETDDTEPTRIFSDNDSEDDDIFRKTSEKDEYIELENEYESQWSGVAKNIPLSEVDPTPVIKTIPKDASDFVAKPEKLQFNNIKPGVIYRKELSLTNVSYSTSNVRFIEMSAALRGLIDLTFTPTPPLSPGMSSKMMIQFEPSAEITVQGTLHFQTATGSLVVPVSICPSVIEPVVDINKLDFGREIIGEEVVRNVIVTNKGNLDGEIKFKLVDVDEDDDSDEILIQTHKENTVYKIEARSSVTIGIKFCPNIPGNLEKELYIDLAEKFIIAPWEEIKHRHTFKVVIVATSDELPVCIDTAEYDFGVCLSGFLYQDEIIITNRANVPKQVTFIVPNSSVQIYPNSGFVQANSSFKAHLRLTPVIEEADKETGLLELNVIVRIADQSTPLSFTLSAIITTNHLLIHNEEIDFGHCTIHEQVVSQLQLTNTSLLIQEFGFLNLPNNVRIRPGDGFGHILPGETLDLEVVFGAERAINYDFELKVRTTSGFEGSTKCTAIGVMTPLVASKSQLNMKTTLYDTSRAAFQLTNNHFDMDQFKHPVPRIGPNGQIFPVGPTSFSIEPTDECGLLFSPSVGTLSPGEFINVSVTHAPTICESKILTVINKPENIIRSSSSSTKSSRRSSASSKRQKQLTKSSNQYWSTRSEMVRQFATTWQTYKVPIFITGDSVEKNHKNAQFDRAYCLWIEINTETCRPTLTIANNYGKPSVEFDTLAAQGQSAVYHLEIENISPIVQHVKTTSLDPHGPFCALNPLPPSMEPGSHHVLDVRFRPNNNVGIYHEQFHIVQIDPDTGSTCSKLHINVRGEAIDAQTRLVCDEKLSLGVVRKNDEIKETILIRNDGTCTVPYRLRSDDSFTISPSSGSLAPDSESKVHINFSSKEQGKYSGFIHLHLFNDPDPVQALQIDARVVEDSLFIEQTDGLEFAMPNLNLFSTESDAQSGPNFSVRLASLDNGLVGSFTIKKVMSSSRSGSSMKKGKGKQGSKAEYLLEWISEQYDAVVSVPLKGQIVDEEIRVQIQLPIRPLHNLPIKLQLTLTAEFTTTHNIHLTLP